VTDGRVYVLFGYGLHTCVGKQLALNEMSGAFARLVREWDFVPGETLLRRLGRLRSEIITRRRWAIDGGGSCREPDAMTVVVMVEEERLANCELILVNLLVYPPFGRPTAKILPFYMLFMGNPNESQNFVLRTFQT
jgi:hypothetical protein